MDVVRPPSSRVETRPPPAGSGARRPCPRASTSTPRTRRTARTRDNKGPAPRSRPGGSPDRSERTPGSSRSCCRWTCSRRRRSRWPGAISAVPRSSIPRSVPRSGTPPPFRRRERFVEQGVVHRPRHDRAFVFHGHGDAETRVAVRVIRGSVEGIDDPPVRRRGNALGALLRQHPVVREPFPDPPEDVPFRFAVHVGHEVDLSLEVDRLLAPETFTEDPAAPRASSSTNSSSSRFPIAPPFFRLMRPAPIIICGLRHAPKSSAREERRRETP